MIARWLLAALLVAPALVAQSAPHWVGTWGCAPQLVEPANMPPAPGLSGNTLRQVVRVTLPGRQVRVHLSNLFGDGPLTMQSVRLPGGIVLFKGSPSVTIPAGEAITSDPLDYELAPMADLAITIAFGDAPAKLTGHPGSRKTSYLQTADAPPKPTTHWYVITGIDTIAPAASAEVIALGDSITDGRGSTTDGDDRWTDNLARRLHANPATAGITVLNEGLGGNAVLAGGLGPPAVDRFDRDVVNQNAPRWLILLEGVNDIGVSKSPAVAENLIAAFRKFIEKARAHNIRVYGVPILPFTGSMYFTPEHEAARQTVNAWIRSSGLFDAVIDMDAAVRDPADPSKLLPAYDTGDHLHPNQAGYQKMAEAVDLALFRP